MITSEVEMKPLVRAGLRSAILFFSGFKRIQFCQASAVPFKEKAREKIPGFLPNATIRGS
jgi:hypothetical protein